MNRSAAMVDLGLYGDAGPILEEGKRFVQMMEERSTLALLDITEGQREMGLGRWNGAVRLLERGLNALKELGVLSECARSLACARGFFLDNGDVDRTRRALDEAEHII